LKSFNVPMLVLGGGGYTIRNVARCWCYETSRLLDVAIPDEVPYNEDMDYYLPDYKLHMPTSNMKNENTKESLEKTRVKIMAQLASLEAVPNVQMKKTPDELKPGGASDSDYESEDERPRRHRRQHFAEFFDDADEADRLDADSARLCDLEEPPSDCGCLGSCDCRPRNPFVASLTNGGSRFDRM
jgi:histone deacetylase 1/2